MHFRPPLPFLPYLGVKFFDFSLTPLAQDPLKGSVVHKKGGGPRKKKKRGDQPTGHSDFPKMFPLFSPWNKFRLNSLARSRAKEDGSSVKVTAGKRKHTKEFPKKQKFFLKKRKEILEISTHEL